MEDCQNLDGVPDGQWNEGHYVTEFSEGEIVFAKRHEQVWYGCRAMLPINTGALRTFDAYGRIPDDVVRRGLRHSRAFAQRRVRRSIRQQRLTRHRDMAEMVTRSWSERRRTPPPALRRKSPSARSKRTRLRPSTLVTFPIGEREWDWSDEHGSSASQ